MAGGAKRTAKGAVKRALKVTGKAANVADDVMGAVIGDLPSGGGGAKSSAPPSARRQGDSYRYDDDERSAEERREYLRELDESNGRDW